MFIFFSSYFVSHVCTRLLHADKDFLSEICGNNYSYFYYRRYNLERKLADADVSEEDQHNILKYLEQKETEYMRLQRHRMGVDDFELLTMIGKGAFGEVYFSTNFTCFYDCTQILMLWKITTFKICTCLLISDYLRMSHCSLAVIFHTSIFFVWWKLFNSLLFYLANRPVVYCLQLLMQAPILSKHSRSRFFLAALMDLWGLHHLWDSFTLLDFFSCFLPSSSHLIYFYR